MGDAAFHFVARIPHDAARRAHRCIIVTCLPAARRQPEQFEDPAQQRLNEVMDGRRHPITMSIIHIEIARRRGPRRGAFPHSVLPLRIPHRRSFEGLTSIRSTAARS
jgi:hypothetical protein